MKTNYVVFYIEDGKPQFVETDKISVALKLCENFRTMAKNGMDIRHVTMSCENSDQVGANGVDSIVDGKCPDGQPYDWVKRRAPDEPKEETCLECQGSGEEFWAGINGLDGDWMTCSYCKGSGVL